MNTQNSELIRLFILCSVGATWLVIGLLGCVLSNHPTLENIGYLLMALIMWFAGVVAYWFKHHIRFVWFNVIVVVVAVWGVQ